MTPSNLTGRRSISARARRWLVVWVGAGSLSFESCRRPAPLMLTDDLVVEAVGCSSVRNTSDGPRCELDASRRLRIAVPEGTKVVRVRTIDDAGAAALDAGAWAATGLHEIVVPAFASRVIVDAYVADRPARGEIHVGPSTRPAWIDETRAIMAKGETDRAWTNALAHENDASIDDRALAKGLLGRIALGRGRAEEAFPLFREAIALHRRSGRASDAADDSFALAFALHQRSQRYTEAREVLDAAGPDLARYPEGRARAPFYAGTLASETGDHRRALLLLRRAETLAHELGMTRLERNARSALALAMQASGRARASLDTLRALAQAMEESASRNVDPPKPCERAELATNLGWALLMVNEAASVAGEPLVESARGPLERALGIEGCADVYVRASAHANLARLALDEGDLATAERHLAETTRVKDARGTDRLGWLELRARLHLARGAKSSALRVIDEGLGIARASLLEPEEWSLLVARGEVMEAMGRPREAAAAFEAAEDVLDDASLLVPLGEGRGGFAASHSQSARALVGIFVNAGDLERALRSGQRARARVVGRVERALRLELLTPVKRNEWEATVRAYRAARSELDRLAADDWSRPTDVLVRASADRKGREREIRSALEGALTILGTVDAPRAELPKPEPSSLVLDVYADVRGFVAFATDASGTVAHRLPSPRELDAEARSRALLGPIEAKIARASRITVRTQGAWQGVDVHGLTWRGAPLIEHASVEYSMGLGRTRDSGGVTQETSLVIGDPTGDLPSALGEAESVATTLESKHTPVRLLTRDAATSHAVIDGLRDARLLHYAGHGVFAGDEGWESELPLAAGSRLTVGDILALTPAPASVVLSGCDAARTTNEAEPLGLAQAFLVAGANEVVAPVRPVGDALAARFGAKLHGRARGSTRVNAREAILAIAKESPTSDWRAFRIVVP